MTTKPQHTNLPWNINGQHIDADKGNCLIAIVKYQHGVKNSNEAEENAAFIVRACNSHYELAKKGDMLHIALFDLKRAYEKVQEHYGLKAETSEVLKNAEFALKAWIAAIADAEGGAA